jgi:hypothetical protein
MGCHLKIAGAWQHPVHTSWDKNLGVNSIISYYDVTDRIPDPATLGDTIQKLINRRLRISNLDIERPRRKVWFYPIQNSIPDIPNHYERRSRRIEWSIWYQMQQKDQEDRGKKLVLATGSDEIIMNSKKSSFCSMEFGKGRLKLVEKIVFCLKISEVIFNFTLSKFRKERWEIRR